MSIKTGYPQDLLDTFMEMPIRESYVKLELLDWNEEFIQDIQGIVTTGSLSFDGKSSMRRTCNFTMVIPDGQDEYELSKIINLNRKFRLYIGYKNNLTEYQDYPDILWFKLGLYVFVSANFNHSTSGTTISVSARDKMCLLNGQIQGVMPESPILHNRETYIYTDTEQEVPLNISIQTNEETGNLYAIDEHNQERAVKKTLLPNLIYRIIYELVTHYGKENPGRVYINDVPNYGRLLVKYIGVNPIYLIKENNEYTNYSATQPTEGDYDIKTAEDLIGYKMVDLVYPGELIAKAGEAVTASLDKICNVFGNFEYFYDVDGNFIFQEKKNYLNNSYIPLTSDEITGQLVANFNKTHIDYSFKDNKIISAFTNNPKWDNIKNDFVVWGKRTSSTGVEYPIYFHLAIDNRDDSSDKDYRQVIYEADNLVGESAASDYYKEMKAFWEKMYDAETGFKDWITTDPTQLDYWLEIYPATGKYAKYSVPVIGRRTYAIEDSDAVCIYPPDIPGLVWYEYEGEDNQEYQTQMDERSKNYFNGYKTVRMPAELATAIVAAEDRKSCFEVAREALYKYLSLQETITIQCLPVYWLEPGDLIDVKDTKSNICGDYIITTMSIPLIYNGMMSITAMRADQRI